MIQHDFWIALWSGHNRVNMVGACIYGVQVPVADSAVCRNRVFHDASLLLIQREDWLGQKVQSNLFAVNVAGLNFVRLCGPTAFVAWKPASIGRPGEELRERLFPGNLSGFEFRGFPR